MKQSQMFIPTLKENPADAECVSHRLLIKAGFIRQNASGIYSYLPMGYKVLRKIEGIVREEMEHAGCLELLMPAMQPAELWRETGRWDIYGPELMRLQDRHGRSFALGATHEEIITSLVRDELTTYKKLPMTLYQIQTKYRDERRPRFGLLRGREFLMKDAYSFHADEVSLDERYKQMYEAYINIFTRCGLDFRAVIADSGAIGGKDTHEFMALAGVGEDTIAYSDASDYSANIEMAEVIFIPRISDEAVNSLDEGEAKQDDQAVIHVQVFQDNHADLYAVLYAAEDEVNDIKVKNAVNVTLLESAAEAIDWTQNDILSHFDNVTVLADNGIKNMVNGVIKANGQTLHFNVNADRDLTHVSFADLRMIKEGDPSPDGKGMIQFARGIEIGQVFKVGTRYSEAMNATFLDKNGRSQPLLMGCYGIGVSRTFAAVAEQHFDDSGLCWPKALAPFALHIIPVNMKDDVQKTFAEELYEQLKNKYDVLLDDRNERAGVKFADSDLIGCPIRVTVGKKAVEQIVEVKVRKTGESLELSMDEVMSFIEGQLSFA